jgi:hypothetical protein
VPVLFLNDRPAKRSAAYAVVSGAECHRLRPRRDGVASEREKPQREAAARSFLPSSPPVIANPNIQAPCSIFAAHLRRGRRRDDPPTPVLGESPPFTAFRLLPPARPSHAAHNCVKPKIAQIAAEAFRKLRAFAAERLSGDGDAVAARRGARSRALRRGEVLGLLRSRRARRSTAAPQWPELSRSVRRGPTPRYGT